MTEGLSNHTYEPRDATNQHGDLVKVGTEVYNGSLYLTFISETGKTGTCKMDVSQAWLYASDVIEAAMKLDPDYIEGLVRESIEKFQSGNY